MNRTILVLSLIGLTGCGVSQSKFAAKAAKAACSWAEECDMLDFYGGDVDSCTTTMEEYYSTVVSEENCPEYDKKAAKSCLKEMKSAECEASSDDDGGESDCASICSGSSDDTGG